MHKIKHFEDLFPCLCILPDVCCGPHCTFRFSSKIYGNNLRHIYYNILVHLNRCWRRCRKRVREERHQIRYGGQLVSMCTPLQSAQYLEFLLFGQILHTRSPTALNPKQQVNVGGGKFGTPAEDGPPQHQQNMQILWPNENILSETCGPKPAFHPFGSNLFVQLQHQACVLCDSLT